MEEQAGEEAEGAGAQEFATQCSQLIAVSVHNCEQADREGQQRLEEEAGEEAQGIGAQILRPRVQGRF